MSVLLDMSLKDWFEEGRRREKEYDSFLKDRKVKRCPLCRSNYYSFERGGEDPGGCQRCLGTEGDLIY